MHAFYPDAAHAWEISFKQQFSPKLDGCDQLVVRFNVQLMVGYGFQIRLEQAPDRNEAIFQKTGAYQRPWVRVSMTE